MDGSTLNIDPFETRSGTNYELCWICQDKNEDKLSNPSKSYHSSHARSAYATLESHVMNFINNDVPLPKGLKIQYINDGSGISSTLMKNEAKQHAKCRALLLPEKVERQLRKRVHPECLEPGYSPLKTRAKLDTSYKRDEPQCVKCPKTANDSAETLWRGSSKDFAASLEKFAFE